MPAIVYRSACAAQWCHIILRRAFVLGTSAAVHLLIPTSIAFITDQNDLQCSALMTITMQLIKNVYDYKRTQKAKRYIDICSFSRHFYPKRHRQIYIVISAYVCSLRIKPMALVLVTLCSTSRSTRYTTPPRSSLHLVFINSVLEEL